MAAIFNNNRIKQIHYKLFHTLNLKTAFFYALICRIKKYSSLYENKSFFICSSTSKRILYGLQ